MEEIKTAGAVRRLGTGTKFTSPLGELAWSDAHAIMSNTANRPVKITMIDGTVLIGILDETPSYLGGYFRKAWLKMTGRKTRKGVPVSEILTWDGQKGPSLAETLTAFVYLNSPGATEDQIAEARATVKMI